MKSKGNDQCSQSRLLTHAVNTAGRGMMKQTRVRRFARLAVPAVALLVASGCYRATIDTGLASSHRSEKIWAHSWIAGLIPPAVVSAVNECDNGVARVETVHTFLNQVVAAVTFGIYTPITITVTCAAASTAQEVLDSEDQLSVSEAAGYDEIRDVFQQASEKAIESESPAYVVFGQAAQ